MLRMLKDWTVAVFIAAIAFVVIGWFTARPNLPDHAPALSVPTLDGATFDLSRLEGKTVVLNFWASWCAPCKREVPEFSRFAKDYPEIAMIGIAVDSGDAAKVSLAAEKFGIDYPVAVATREVVRAYDVSTLPTTVIVGPDGKIKRLRVGEMSYEQLFAATH